MLEPVRHRQTKGAATDMFVLPPPRHTPTLPIASSIAHVTASVEFGLIEIEFAGKARIRIPASIPAELAAAVVKALSGR